MTENKKDWLNVEIQFLFLCFPPLWSLWVDDDDNDDYNDNDDDDDDDGAGAGAGDLDRELLCDFSPESKTLRLLLPGKTRPSTFEILNDVWKRCDGT